MHLHREESHRLLSEIELSGIIHRKGGSIRAFTGSTKKYKLTISSDMVKKTLQKDLTLQDVV